MKRAIRIILISSGILCALAVFVVVAGILTMQSSWFKNKVRQSIVSNVEHATGGRVQLGSFQYDWRTRTAEVKNFVLRGSEPPDAAPFFHASSIRITLRLISLWRKDIDLESVVVKKSESHLIVRPDGSNNMPTPVTGPFNFEQVVTQLLQLRIRHFSFDNASFQANLNRIPLNADGDDLTLSLRYDRKNLRYNVELSSPNLHVVPVSFPAIAMNVEAKAQLGKDLLTIQQLIVSSKHSSLDVSGTVTSLAHPVLDLNLHARLPAADLARELGEQSVREGQVSFDGYAHYAGWEAMLLKGHLRGERFVLRSGFAKLERFDAVSEISATAAGAQLSHLSVSALGATLAGSASFNKDRQFRIDGNLEGANLRSIISTSDKPFPWSGIAHGPVHLQGRAKPNLRDLQARAQLQIAPASEGIPISGNLDLSYDKKKGTLRIEDSQLYLPYTHAAFSGVLGESLKLELDSTNLADLTPALNWSSLPRLSDSVLQNLPTSGSMHFNGTIDGPLDAVRVAGNLQMTDARFGGLEWKRIRTQMAASSTGVDIASLTIEGSALHAKAAGHIALTNWQIQPQSLLRGGGTFQGADMRQLLSVFQGTKPPPINGIASGSIKVSGSLADPQGIGEFSIDSLDAYGERLNLTRLSATLSGNLIGITSGRVQTGPAIISFSGSYQHSANSLETGRLEANVNSNGFPIASLGWVRRYEPGLNAQLEVHGKVAVVIQPNSIQPSVADGTVILRAISVNKINYGNLLLKTSTKNAQLDADISGDLRDSRLSGQARLQLGGTNTLAGDLHLSRMKISTIAALVDPAQAAALPVEGQLEVVASFSGSLQDPSQMRGVVQISDFQVQPKLPIGDTKPADLVFRSIGPIELDAASGVASFREFEIRGPETALKIAGAIPYLAQRPLKLSLNGAIDLRMIQLLQPSLRTSGQSMLGISVDGTLSNPKLSGSLQVRNAAVFSGSFPNGLTGINGIINFANDRATIQQLNAESGGGKVSLAGSVSFRGGALVYNLKSNAQDVRVRYGGGFSVTANSDLSLTGTSKSSLIAGNLTVSRIGLNADVDAGSLMTSLSGSLPAASNQQDFVNGLRLDVHVESAANLQLSTSLSRDVEGEIDLHLRGSPDHPILLGSVSASQGDIRIFGTKYSINRGQVTFSNPAKIEPLLDLDLQTLSRGITVDITVSGNVNKLNINYRSDPPLQPRDIIALLAVGRAPDIASSVPNAQITNDASALQTGANTVLGQAISPVSNRLSKLFGITNIKIDPLVQGITNTPQARLTLEQQVSRDITVTYITNLSQTSEQIFRFEWALSAHYSVIALRDDNGEFGLDLQYRKRFK